MRLNLMIGLMLFSISTVAQNARISGKIILKDDHEVEKTVASLLKASDSTLLKSVFCDKEGTFIFDKVKSGKYKISFTHISYELETTTQFEVVDVNQEINLPFFEMSIKKQLLATVNVTAKKQFIEQKIDRLVLNPSLLIGNAGVTSLEILERAPGVLVDIEGKISLKGKSGVLVFVDDKPTYLAATDLAGYLRSLPSGSVESIEIMTNPPAKYEASGNAGIINIRLKKNKALGYSGSLSLSYGQGKYSRTNNSFNFNYRVDKINYFANLGVNDNNSFQNLYINRYYYENDGRFMSSFLQNSYIKREMKSNS